MWHIQNMASQPEHVPAAMDTHASSYVSCHIVIICFYLRRVCESSSESFEYATYLVKYQLPRQQFQHLFSE